MVIRKAEINDLDRLLEFNLNLAKETENLDLDKEHLKNGILKILDSKVKSTYFVCEVDGFVVGQTMIIYEWSDWRNGEYIWIQSVYVDARYRKNGVFKKLYDYIKSYCDSDDMYLGIRLYVDRNNIKAKEAYKALGMEHSHYDLYEYSKQ